MLIFNDWLGDRLIDTAIVCLCVYWFIYACVDPLIRWLSDSMFRRFVDSLQLIYFFISPLIRGVADSPIKRFFDSRIQLFADPSIRWFIYLLIHRFWTHWYIGASTRWFVDLSILRFVNSLNRRLIDLLTRWFIDAVMRWFLDSSIRRFADSMSHCAIYSLSRWRRGLLMHWWSDSMTHSFTRLFIYRRIQSFIDICTD